MGDYTRKVDQGVEAGYRQRWLMRKQLLPQFFSVGHGHWVNSLALSTEYTLRTGAFDHTGKTYSSAEEMKEAALAKYGKMKRNAPERLVSGSDDFTMILWEPAINKLPKARLTGHQQPDQRFMSHDTINVEFDTFILRRFPKRGSSCADESIFPENPS
ncbi:hypothetical protein KSP40_PGU021730 [Platanthera guangdongensis]|uniref:Uncharacterized protein n=1 Tax=Platanthera guangdongensis TaxID=2320717 RepID=A0ABR2M5T6_9ASPA